MSAEPDFSGFKDWLIEGPVGLWPDMHDTIDRQSITPEQQQVVQRNVAMFGNNGDPWEAKVSEFEAELNKLHTAKDRNAERNRYEIRFDSAGFQSGITGHAFKNRRFPCSVSFNGIRLGNNNLSFDDSVFVGENVSLRGINIETGNLSLKNISLGTGHFSVEAVTVKKGNVWFEPNTNVSTSISLRDMEIGGDLFINGNFPQHANFQRLTVSGTANFSDCNFGKIPDFRDTKFDRPPEVARMQVPEPPMLSLSHKVFWVCSDSEAVSRLRTLKGMAIRAHDHEMDGKFFALEMMAKRGTETTSAAPLVFSSLYGFLSGYGQDFVRPFFALVASWIFFAVLYFNLLPASDLSLASRNFFVFEFSFRNTVPLVNALFRSTVSPTDHLSQFQRYMDSLFSSPGEFDIFTGLAASQQLIGAVLVFLFLLALRNTFRLK